VLSKVRWQVSLDSVDSRSHDALRGKWKETMRGLALLREQGAAVTVLTVMSRANESGIDDVYDFCERIGARFCCTPMQPFGAGRDSGANRLSASEILEAMEAFGAQHSLDWRSVRRVFNTARHVQYSWGDRQTCCDLGKGVLSVSPDGTVYPCVHLHGSVPILGNILEAGIEDILLAGNRFRAGLAVDILPECRTCGYRYLCGGGCRAERILTGERDPEHCNLIRGVIERDLALLIS